MQTITRRGTPARAALAAILASAGAAHAQTYRPIVIPPIPGSTFSATLGVNDNGDAVGFMTIPGSPQVTFRGFFYDRATNTTTDIGSLGATTTFEVGAHSINNSGRVVGVFRNAEGRPRSFTWTAAGGIVDISLILPNLNPISSAALSIGDGGQIGGANTFGCVASPTFGVIGGAGWGSPFTQAQPVIFTTFACGFAGTVYGVNATGQMAGETLVSDTISTTKIKPIVVGGFGQLPTYGDPHEVGVAYDVSDDGWACGHAEDSTPAPGVFSDTACVWSPAGVITNLLGTSPGTQALGINTSHDVVGWMFTSLRQGAIWPGATPGPVNINSLLVSPIPGGLFVTQCEDISNSGFIACRTNETSAGRAVLLEPCTPGIVSAPAPQAPLIGGTATFTVSAAGAGTLTFQWRRNTVPLTDGPTANGSIISGSLTDTLTINSVAAADQGSYDVVLTSACGSRTSVGVALTVPPCTADFNGDHSVNVSDLTFFLGRFGTTQPPGTNGDLNGDGVVNVADLTAFLGQFGRICP